jgi:uncharacterized protein YndB with AHSA1/START domain
MTATPNKPASATGTKPFIISRIFDAPRALVWKAWADADTLMKWFGPKGFTITYAKLDLRPGGTFLYGMKTPDGKEMWGKFVYREITAPERIVLVNSFSDAAGGLTRHPMSPNWPLEMLTTATFEDENGKTKLTIRWEPLNATDTERQTFDGAHGSMNQGWGGTFDKLTEFLAKA